METDKKKLQATFVYDDEKVDLKTICEALDKESQGRYKPRQPEQP